MQEKFSSNYQTLPKSQLILWWVTDGLAAANSTPPRPHFGPRLSCSRRTGHIDQKISGVVGLALLLPHRWLDFLAKQPSRNRHSSPFILPRAFRRCTREDVGGIHFPRLCNARLYSPCFRIVENKSWIVGHRAVSPRLPRSLFAQCVFITWHAFS